MAVGIGDVMRHCRNYFEVGCREGEFVISGGNMLGLNLAGRYIAIRGSIKNDGVHQVNDMELQDETFNGRVWLLAPPASFIALCEDISAFDGRSPSGAMLSESFGNYSYTRGTNGKGQAQDWQSAYAGRLAAYQLLSSEVMA